MPKVTMPQLGESVAEGTIGKWLKNVGDHVDKYEPIVEVITDKVNAEVPSPFEGTLTEILVKEGETVPNLAEIAVIEGAGDIATPAPAAAGAPAERTVLAWRRRHPGSDSSRRRHPQQQPPPRQHPRPRRSAHGPAGSDERTVEEMHACQPASSNGTAAVDAYEGRMTPAVRRLAREHGVDLSKLQGTGHAGRVTREDVLHYVEGGGAAAVAQAPTAQVPAARLARHNPSQPPPRRRPNRWHHRRSPRAIRSSPRHQCARRSPPR